MSEMSLSAMNWADYAIISLIFVSAVISIVRGFVREAISLATWILAVWVGFKFAPAVGQLLQGYIETLSIRVAIGFLILFFLILILGSLLNYLISTLVNKTGLSGTDRLVGLIFGVARGVLFVAVLVMLGKMSAVDKEPWWRQAQLAPKFYGLADWLQNFIPDQLKKVENNDNKADYLIEMRSMTRALESGDNQKSADKTKTKQPAAKVN